MSKKEFVANQLNDSSKTFQQNLEIVLKSGKISDKTMRLFAVWCAREVSYLITNDSQKKIYLETLMVAENFAYGKATAEQLLAAWDAARDAALSAARGAAWSAARDAAWSAAWSAAWDAARDAAYKPKWYIKLVEFRTRVSMQDKQKNKLIEMIGEES